jgi:Holliday junction resolvase
MTPEAAVKTAVKKYLVAEGVYYFMPVSNGMGRHGIPDIICCVNSTFVAIECKAGKGKVTALQEREMQHIRDAGGHAIVVSDDHETFVAMSVLITYLKHKHENS